MSRAELCAGCHSGALEKAQYEALLSAAGFVDFSIEITHTYLPQSVACFLGPESVEVLPPFGPRCRCLHPGSKANG